MKMKLQSYLTRKSKIKKENKRPELSNSVIMYLIRFPSHLTCFFLFSFFKSNVFELRKISCDVTI